MTNKEISEDSIVVVACVPYIAYKFIDEVFGPAVSLKPLTVCDAAIYDLSEPVIYYRTGCE